MKFFAWITVISSSLGGILALVDFARAESAPQQAAAAAFGLLCAVVPYTIARALELTRTPDAPPGA